jgi:AcrR family transcriptional regulator
VRNATLYRHFPDRNALLNALAAQVIVLTAEAARSALAEEPDSYQVSRKRSWLRPHHEH